MKMRRFKKIAATTVALSVLAATPVAASTRLQKLSEDRYLITHQKQTGFAGQGKAVRMSHEKAASLCVILGYAWFEVRDTQSQGRGFAQNASATLEVKFYETEEKEDLNNCEALASEEQKEKMAEVLKKSRASAKR